MSRKLATTPLTFSLLFYTSLITSIFEVMSARLPDIYWNSTNPIFRIDNTDHIIDVNRGNAKFEYDQINIICPMYTKGTREEDIETYIIYNVSKEEYDGCHIANPALARTIAVCDKPFLNRYYTVTFRPFTPQPGGLEFHHGQDYYFIALSAKPGDTINHCHKYHMKVVFKVCCSNNNNNKQQQQSSSSSSTSMQQQQPQSPSSSSSSSSLNIHNRPSIASKSETNNNGILIGGSNQISSSTITPSSTSMPQSSTFSFLEFSNNNNNVNNANNNNAIGIATYKGVISNHNSTVYPMIIRHHPKPTRSSSIIDQQHHQSSSLSNNYDNNRIVGGSSHRFYGDPRGRYPINNNNNNNLHYPSLFSTERPLLSPISSQINSPTRIPHVPYHPYHPRQLTSTLRPVHVGWRPHPIPNNHHNDHNPPIRLSDQRSIGYKGIYRSNDNREKSDGLNSHSSSTIYGQSITILSVLSIALSTIIWFQQLL